MRETLTHLRIDYVTRIGVTRIVLSRLAMTRITQIITVSAVLAAVAACTAQPDPVDPPAPPSVPLSSAPTPSPSATLTQEDKDRAEAEQAYRRASDLVDEVAMIKGPKKLTKELEEVADPDGPWYQNQQRGIDRYNTRGTYWDRASVVLESKAVRYSNPQRIILFACVDARGVQILDSDGQVAGSTSLIAGYLTMRKSDQGGWRAFRYDKRGFVRWRNVRTGSTSRHPCRPDGLAGSCRTRYLGGLRPGPRAQSAALPPGSKAGDRVSQGPTHGGPDACPHRPIVHRAMDAPDELWNSRSHATPATRIVQALAVSAVLATAAACTPQPGSIEPTDPPSTPTSSAPPPSPSPSLSQEDKDRAEAEQAYRRASDLVDEVAMIKGPKTLTPELEEVADPDGPWYRNQQQGIDRYNNEGIYWDRKSIVVDSKVARYSSPDRIILFACIDGRDVKILKDDRLSGGDSSLIGGYLTMRRSEEFGWRVFGYDRRGFVEVDTCEQAELSSSDVPS